MNGNQELLRIYRSLGASSIGIDAAAVLDAVWLSSILPSQTVIADPTDTATPEPGRSINPNDFSGATGGDELDIIETAIQSTSGNVHAAGFGSGSMSHRGDSFKLPRVPALPQVLQLERGLRTLVRRADSTVEMVVDEYATAEATAEVGSLQLRLHPKKVRSLSATFVIEHSPTMRFWLDNLCELPKLFWRTGGFRNLETFFLNSFESRPKLYRDRQVERPANIRRVNCGNSGGVVFFVTDGRSTPWLNGTLAAILSDWSSQQTTVVLTVIDSNLWGKTAFENSKLSVGKLRWPQGPAQLIRHHNIAPQACVPVVPITPEKLKRLGPLIWADAGSETSCIRLDITKKLIGEVTPSIPFVPTEQLGAAAIDRFMKTASPEAISLARSFASIPLFLPIMRLTQHCLHATTGISHLAEILWSGMVYRRDYQTPIAPGSNTNHIEFDFLPRVRNSLLDQTSILRVSNVFNVLTRYLASQHNFPSHVGAILDNPRGLIEWTASGLPDNQKPFARVASQVLKRLGGEYEKVGSELEKLSQAQQEGFVQVTAENKIRAGARRKVAEPLARGGRVEKELDVLPYPFADMDVEDGTNIKKGTKFVLMPQSWPTDLYVPSKAKETTRWVQRLIELKREFQRIVENEPAMSCQMIQMRIPEFPGRENIEEWFGNIQPHMAKMGGGLRKDLVQLGDKHRQTLFGVFAFSDVQGKPIQNSVGEPFAFRYGFSRSNFLLKADAHSRQKSELSVAFERGTNLLFEVPSSIATHIWKYWPEGFSRRDNSDQYLWIGALFELGWQAKRSSGMFVERFARSDKGKAELKGKGHFPRLPKNCSADVASQIAHENGFPVQIYSEIEDLGNYSISVLDDLIYRAAMIEMERAESLEKRGDIYRAERYARLSLELLEEVKNEFEMASAFKFLGTVQHRQQRYTDAEHSLQRALDLELRLELLDDAIETQVQLAQVLDSAGNPDAAINMLIESGQMALGRGQLHKFHERNLMAAVIQRKRGSVENALVVAREVAQFARENEDESLILSATIEYVTCLCELRQFEEADVVLQGLFTDSTNSESNLKFATAKLIHGKTLHSLERPREAIVALELASKLLVELGETATEADAKWSLAKSHHTLGNVNEADTFAMRAKELFRETSDDRGQLIDEWISKKLRKPHYPKVDVFVSHIQQYKESVVSPLVEALSEIGVTCWIDRQKLEIGQEWIEQISKAIKSSTLTLLVISSSYLKSSQTMNMELAISIRREMEEGRNRLIALYVDTPDDLTVYPAGLAGRNGLRWNNNPQEIAQLIQRRLDEMKST